MAFSQDTSTTDLRDQPATKSKLFDVAGGWNSIIAAIDGNKAQSPAANETAAKDTAALSQDEDTLDSSESFGSEQARSNASLSEFSVADPKTAQGFFEKLRRDINSPLNIGGGGGTLYTEDKNPWGESKDDKDRDRANEALGEMVETSQQSLKREREELQRKREQEWSDMMRTDFGVDMSPEDWHAAAENYKDPKKRAATLRRTQKEQGWSDQQAQSADTMAGRIFAIMEDETLSKEQKKRQLDNLKTENPNDFKRGLILAENLKTNDAAYQHNIGHSTADVGRAATQDASLNARDSMLSMAGDTTPLQTVATASSMTASKTTTVTVDEDQKLFASAPQAGAHFAIAASGVVPATSTAKPAPAATVAAAVKPDALVC